VSGGNLSVSSSADPATVPDGEVMASAISVSVGDEIRLENVRISIQGSAGSPPRYVGIDVADGADVVVSGGLVSVDGGIALRSVGSRLTASDGTFYASGLAARGAWLEDSPGSSVSGASASGYPGVGVRVTGESTGVVIGDVRIAGTEGSVGVELEDCTGEPLVAGTITGVETGYGMSSDRAYAIHALGDCHPRIEGAHIALSKQAGPSSSSLRAIRCDVKDGVASQCIIHGNRIDIDYTLSGGGSGWVVGVQCAGGSCAEVTSNIVTMNDRSYSTTHLAAYGVIYEGTPIVSGNSLEALCNGDAPPPEDCWDDVVTTCRVSDLTSPTCLPD
jgi:hypothetical protein